MKKTVNIQIEIDTDVEQTESSYTDWYSAGNMFTIKVFAEKHLGIPVHHTLAHELGHLVMHRFPSPDMENEAHAFASAFLMPAGDIRPYLQSRRIDLQLLASLKPEWRVSMQSIIMRA